MKKMLPVGYIGSISLFDATINATAHILKTSSQLISYILFGSGTSENPHNRCSMDEEMEVIMLFLQENDCQIESHASSRALKSQIILLNTQIRTILLDIERRRTEHNSSMLRYWTTLHIQDLSDEIVLLNNNIQSKFNLLMNLLRTFANLNVAV